MVTVDVELHRSKAATDLPRPRLIIGGEDVLEVSGGFHDHVDPATGEMQALFVDLARRAGTRTA
ncbi:hypothetical protein [Actinomadura physcomitrii]|uniref:hypothetical protein n=1 Tax=Actinomadura physcomitrii TaxID=2650748 RepID=UPI0019234D31|nr:hypothetical protein [Actinomadura physcomitrii]